MRLPQFCVRHPVTTFVLNFLIILLGIVGFDRLGIRQFPKIEKQQVQVITSYPGASSELMEREITSPLEGALSGIEGIERMTSVSEEGLSTIQIDLDWGVPTDQLMGTLRDRLSGVQDTLPDTSMTPQIYRQGSDNPLVMYLSFQDEHQKLDEFYDYLQRYVRPGLERLQGVSQVKIMGGSSLAMRVYPDPERMAVRGVTVSDLSSALHGQNMALPSGEIQSQSRKYPIATQTTLTDGADFKKVVVLTQVNYPVRLSEVAEVVFGSDPSERAPALLDGRPALIFKISADQSANPIEVAHRIHAYLGELKRNLPKGQLFNVLYDATKSIQSSISSVYHTMIEAIVLVGLVMWVFLGSMRAAIIPVVTIPVCLLGVAFWLYCLDFSVNNLTLLAAVLSIGLVVDDAIVMVENVFRRLERGEDVLSAVRRSADEIGFAIVIMTTTLAAVYAPIALTQGLSGKLFKEFALTLSGAVLISGFVALTLSPVLCLKLLKPHPNEPFFDRIVGRISSSYAGFLPRVLKHPILGLCWILLLWGAGLGTYHTLPQEFAPLEDTDVVLIALSPPVGASQDFIYKATEKVTQVAARVPEARQQLSFPGFDILFLKPHPIRTDYSNDIAKRLFAPLQTVPGIKAFPFVPPPLSLGGSSMGDGIEFYIRTTTAEYSELASEVSKLQKELSLNANLVNVDVDFKPNSPQLVLKIDRERAALLQVSIEEIARSVQALFAGLKASRYETGGQLYDVLIQLPPHLRKSVEALSHFYVRNRNNQMIPISSLIRQDESVISPTRQHVDRMRAIQVTANLAEGYALSDAVKSIESVIHSHLSPGFETIWGGQVKTFLNEGSALWLTFAMALLFIYLVLSAQFESFFDPFIILLTVPCSIAGGVVLLKLVGGSINVYTQIAFITLIGLITKHGILIVEFANTLQKGGLPLNEAILKSASLRLRPILMTTAAMVFGAIPLVWVQGYGAISRAQMGWVIIGGMSIGTVFSLTVMPLGYWGLNRLRTALMGPRQWGVLDPE